MKKKLSKEKRIELKCWDCKKKFNVLFELRKYYFNSLGNALCPDCKDEKVSPALKGETKRKNKIIKKFFITLDIIQNTPREIENLKIGIFTDFEKQPESMTEKELSKIGQVKMMRVEPLKVRFESLSARMGKRIVIYLKEENVKKLFE